MSARTNKGTTTPGRSRTTSTRSTRSQAPEVFLGAASRSRVAFRLGHGIMQLTTSHPAKVAERIAVLDQYGRVEFSIGAGASITEREVFDVAMDDKHAF